MVFKLSTSVSVMVVVSSCQSSHASFVHCFWQLRNVITVHNEEWNQLDHHHASKIELAPLKVSLNGFLPAFLNENTIFFIGDANLRWVSGPQSPPTPPVKDIWKSLNNQQRSVTHAAYESQSGRSDSTKVTDQTLKLKWGAGKSQ